MAKNDDKTTDVAAQIREKEAELAALKTQHEQQQSAEKPAEEEHVAQPTLGATHPHNDKTVWIILASIGGVFLLIAAVAFGAGIGAHYNTTQQMNPGYQQGGYGQMTNGGNGQNQGTMRSSRNVRGTSGTVSAVSSTSVTIKDQSGTSATFAISSNTTVRVISAATSSSSSDNGTTNSSRASVSDGKISDVATGDTVMIRTTSSDTKTASVITVLKNEQ